MKKFFAFFIASVLLLGLIGCTTNETNIEQATNIKQPENENIEIWTDPETGVQYIIYDRKAGYGGMGGITPRLNADGTPYIVAEKGGAE